MTGDPLEVARIVMLIIGASLAWGFCVTYDILSEHQWTHNPHGVHLMIFTAAVGEILTYILLYRLDVVPVHWAPVVSLVLYAQVAALILWRIVLLLQAHRKGGR